MHLGFTNVILLYTDHPQVSANLVVIYRVVSEITPSLSLQKSNHSTLEIRA